MLTADSKSLAGSSVLWWRPRGSGSESGGVTGEQWDSACSSHQGISTGFLWLEFVLLGVARRGSTGLGHLVLSTMLLLSGAFPSRAENLNHLNCVGHLETPH